MRAPGWQAINNRMLLYSEPQDVKRVAKEDVYEVDLGIFENIANQYKVESEDVVNLKQSSKLYALSS